MIEENELVDLMTKCGESYFSDKIQDGNRYAKELISKLDFSERRDQEVLIQVVGHALVRHDEIVVLDYLKEAGFDFGMKFDRGVTLKEFFAKYPKYSDFDNAVFKKIAEYGGIEDKSSAYVDNLFNIFYKCDCEYNFWWEVKTPFYDPQCKKLSQEQNESIMQIAAQLSGDDAQVLDKYGLTLLHYGAWHNCYDMVEHLLKNGADPNIQAKNDNGYKGTTPLQLACFMGNFKMVELLAANGADVTLRDDMGRTPLHYLSLIEIDGIKDCITGQTESASQRAEILPLLMMSINIKDNNGRTPLMNLVSNRWTCLSHTMTELYLKLGADTSEKDNNGNTALMLSAKSNNITAAMLLMQHKDTIDLQNNDGDTALHLAVREENTEIAYALIDMGADISVENNDGNTQADEIENGWNDELREKAERKTKEEPKDMLNMIRNTFFHCESCEGDSLPFALHFVKKLLSKIDPDDDDDAGVIFNILNSTNDENYYPHLLKAIFDADIDFTAPFVYSSQVVNVRDFSLKPCYGIPTVEMMSKLGIDLDTAYIKGRTPANIVASCERTQAFIGSMNDTDYGEAARYFSSDSMTELDENGTTAMHIAARRNHDIMMKVMIETGADINATEDAPGIVGATPLHWACAKGNEKIVEILMNANADDSLITKDGETAAHFAARKVDTFRDIDSEKRLAVAKLLKTVNVKRNDGKTPLILAQTLDFVASRELTAVFVEKGADVNCADNDGNTALIVHTYEHCDKETVKVLVQAGADVNAQNKKGLTPLHNALDYGNEMVARYLIKKGARYNIADNRGRTAMDIAAEKGYEVVLDLMDLSLAESEGQQQSQDKQPEQTVTILENNQKPKSKITLPQEATTTAVSSRTAPESDDERVARQLDATRRAFITQFGEERGERIFAPFSVMTRIQNEGINDSNRQEYEEASKEYMKLFQEFGREMFFGNLGK